MLSMLRLLMIVSLLITSLWSSNIDNTVTAYEKKRISRNSQIKLKSLKLFFKKDLKQNGWVGYVFDITINVKGKDINIKDMLFSNGTMIAPELISIKTKQSFKKMMYPKLSSKYYDEKYLIAGDKKAKHSIVIFSDPLCPICVETVPQIIKNIKKNPKNVALYYIEMPLDMHPTAKLIVKATLIAKKQGIKDIDYKVYTANFNKQFDPYKEKNKQKVLDIFNKKFNTKITMKQINSKDINKEIEHSSKLTNEALVQGTPTVFFDKEIDSMRNKYLKYLK